MNRVLLKDRLKELRISKGMSQADLAKLLDIDKVAVSQWERGVRQPKAELKEALCDIFNVNMDYLLGRTDYTTKIIHSSDIESDGLSQLLSERPALRRLMSHFSNMSDAQLLNVIELFNIGDETSTKE